MLREFTFENFKCYRDQATLHMDAAPLEEHADSLIEGIGGACVPVAAIYGPNAGGKSSVLQAFQCLRDYVTLPYFVLRQRGKSAPQLECRPYAFEAESRRAPTTFCVLFDSGAHTYRYILSVRDGMVEEEYLHRRKAGRGATATVFERIGGAVELGPALRRRRIGVEVDRMMPYLSFLAINYDLEQADEAFGWFLDCAVLDYSVNRLEDLFVEPGAEEKSQVVDALNAMGIDVVDIRYDRGPDGRLDDIYLRHEAGDGSELRLAEESNGTRKLLNLVPPVLAALGRGSVVVSDELDAKLHPKLLRYIIRLFTDKRTNPRGAQLLMTSHDMSTLNSSVFRRDEIWFAARTPEGPASLYCLADISDVDGRRIRPANAYDRQYLAGRYGADPYLRSILSWEGEEAGARIQTVEIWYHDDTKIPNRRHQKGVSSKNRF